MGKVKLQDFKELKVKMPDIQRNCEKAATGTTEQLRGVQWERNRKRNQYSKGWEWGLDFDGEYDMTAIVHNVTNWQLTWLLENGHLVTNKRGGIGWASPHDHIGKAFREYSKEFVEDMRNIGIEVEIR